jgi:hypothetical protein
VIKRYQWPANCLILATRVFLKPRHGVNPAHPPLDAFLVRPNAAPPDRASRDLPPPTALKEISNA